MARILAAETRDCKRGDRPLPAGRMLWETMIQTAEMWHPVIRNSEVQIQAPGIGTTEKLRTTDGTEFPAFSSVKSAVLSDSAV
jgi:hypothetical protein